MPRLPKPGQDHDNWGLLLNEYLGVELHPDGALKKAPQIAEALSTATSAKAMAEQHAQGTWITVKDYGAIGNGIVDDTKAIQAAIDDAAKSAQATYGGGTVFVPAGLYAVTSTLILKKHVLLRGEGMNTTTIRLAPNANCVIIKTASSPDNNGANADCTGLVDIGFNGNRGQQDSGNSYHAVVLETNPRTYQAGGDSFFDMHHLIQNVRVHEVKGNGFHFYGRAANQVMNAFASNCTGYGFYSTFDVNYSHCESDGAGKDGFYINNGSIRLSNCKSFVSGQIDKVGAGFHMGNAASGVSLATCEAQNNYGPGFYLESCGRINLSACVADSNNFGMTGNFAGFQLKDSSFNTIQGGSSQGKQNNTLVGNQQNALRIIGNSANNSIIVSHSANNGATIGAALSADSIAKDSFMVFNGQLQG